jgi:hypothetical protein
MIADAVLMGLLHRQSPDRRHLVVALATSEDWCSLSSGDALRRGAERSGAVFHWINMTGETIHGTPPGPVPLGVRGQCRTEGNPTDIGGILGEAARVTGGTVHSQWFGTWDHIDRVAVEAFDKIFDDFRRSYVLYYVPRGVDPAGWHRLRVETPGKNFALRSRTGYWALTDAPAPSRK